MALIAFASAKGSPGVSLAVNALSQTWSRDVIVADLDPAGGDTELVLRNQDGDPLEPDSGLVSLGAAVRGGKAADIGDHLQTTFDGGRVLVGVTTPSQVQGLGPVWPHIASALASLPTDVFADCGRFLPGSPVQPVVEAASALVFVTRNDLPSLAHLRERLLVLSDPLSIGRQNGTPVGIAMVGDPRDSRALTDAVKLFGASGVDVTPLGTIAHDPRSVTLWWTLPERTRRKSFYHRSLVDVSERLRDLVGGDS